MASVKLDTVRSGVQLLSGLMKAADQENDDNGKVSRADVSNFTDMYGDGASLDDAMSKLHAYARAKFDTANPTLAEMNKALADAMKATAKGDLNKNKYLSPTEQKQLAKTWDAVVEFAKDYKGMTVDDVVSVNNGATP